MTSLVVRLAMHSRWVELRQDRYRRPQIPSEGHCGLWWNHDATCYTESGPVKLHEMLTRSYRYHGGAAELFGQPDSPAIDEDLCILRRHINLQGTTG